jgi:hypothetical protein
VCEVQSGVDDGDGGACTSDLMDNKDKINLRLDGDS